MPIVFQFGPFFLSFSAANLSINNVSFSGGRGVSQILTMADMGGGGSEMAKIRLTLLMHSP